jgi:CMP-N,N'-diacetyllegionaminic acid synthase
MICGKRVLAITLARGGSKTIPRKNIIDICGKPLLFYTISEAQKSKFIDDYVVSSDDDEICDVAKKNDVLVHKRSSATSTDVSSSASAIAEVLSCFSGYDIIVELMTTNPLKTVDDIDGCVAMFCDKNAHSVVSVMRVFDHHPSRIKFIIDDKLHDFYPEIPESRRQDLSPAAYVRNGSIYVFKPENILNYGVRLIEPYAFVMSEERCINIDEQRDLEYARQVISNYMERK